jgi:hypothetical protein
VGNTHPDRDNPTGRDNPRLGCLKVRWNNTATRDLFQGEHNAVDEDGQRDPSDHAVCNTGDLSARVTVMETGGAAHTCRSMG